MLKKSSKSSLKKKGRLMGLIYLSNIQTKLAINFLKKNFCTWPILGLALKGLKSFVSVDVSHIVFWQYKIFIQAVKSWPDNFKESSLS